MIGGELIILSRRLIECVLTRSRYSTTLVSEHNFASVKLPQIQLTFTLKHNQQLIICYYYKANKFYHCFTCFLRAWTVMTRHGTWMSAI